MCWDTNHQDDGRRSVESCKLLSNYVGQFDNWSMDQDQNSWCSGRCHSNNHIDGSTKISQQIIARSTTLPPPAWKELLFLDQCWQILTTADQESCDSTLMCCWYLKGEIKTEFTHCIMTSVYVTSHHVRHDDDDASGMWQIAGWQE